MIKELNEKKMEDLIRDNNQRVRKMENELKDFYIEREQYTLNEKYLREKV